MNAADTCLRMHRQHPREHDGRVVGNSHLSERNVPNVPAHLRAFARVCMCICICKMHKQI